MFAYGTAWRKLLKHNGERDSVMTLYFKTQYLQLTNEEIEMLFYAYGVAAPTILARNGPIGTCFFGFKCYNKDEEPS